MPVVAILFPNTPESKFDMDYYLESHVNLVTRLLEPYGLVHTRVLQGVSAGGVEPPFHAFVEVTFADVQRMNDGLASHGPETQADLPNFTNCTPITQICDVTLT